MKPKCCLKKKDFESFWIAQRSTYPRLWEFLKVFILAFPTTYLVEKGFSAVVNLLQSNRNRLQIATKGNLRLFLSDVKPDFSALTSRHQAQAIKLCVLFCLSIAIHLFLF